MARVRIEQVRGLDRAVELTRLNAAYPQFFNPLKHHHLRDGFWHLALYGNDPIGFAGSVAFNPFPRAGYFKRVAVLDAHRGKGVALELTRASLAHAKAHTDWTHMISECALDNIASANNLIRAGFQLCAAERPWEKRSLFWSQQLKAA